MWAWLLVFVVTSVSCSLSNTRDITTRDTIRNITIYPVCVQDKDCGRNSGRLCFQYMCYPWETSSNFRWCSKDSDCDHLTDKEGGQGRWDKGGCFRHEDRKNVNFGICLKRSELKKCQTHSECRSPLKCTNGYCGDPTYFRALQALPCELDQECESRLTGEMCCFDLSTPHLWSPSPTQGSSWPKKCCNNPSGHPVIRPPRNISSQQITKLDQGIAHLRPLFLDFVVCEALAYPMMMRLENCKDFTTTTTSTMSPRRGHQTSQSINTVGAWNMFLLFAFSLLCRISCL